MRVDQEHEQLAMKILASFQITELMLKIYIMCAYSIIRASLNGRIPFGYTFKHVETMPLERLMAIFAQLNDNTDLQKRLNRLVKDRNEIAHRAMLYRFEAITTLFVKDVDERKINLPAIEQEIDACGVLLVKEAEAIMAVYHASHA